LHGLGPEGPNGSAGDEVALKVEGVMLDLNSDGLISASFSA
jgi:hypothetical protein